MRTILFIALGSLVFLGFKGKQEPEFLMAQNKWVDSVFNSLTPRQRLAQLFMIAAYSNKDIKHVREIHDLIDKYNIGGLIWMQGGPGRQAKLANYYQSVAKTPLLYSIDGEWGLAMRLDSTPHYPKQMTLGAIQNDSLIFYMGRQIARECKRLGIHVNFAPVADINNNPNNPVIGMRSFGENKIKVSQKAAMYMLGMQYEHVMANGKHFPGHGDTDVDSHKGLPIIKHSKERLDTLELYPFKYLFDRGLASIMVAHMNILTLDTTQNLASTLSPKVVNDLLKTQMGFKGLIFTDALNMKGVSKFFEPGKVDVKALLAGNDVLLFSESVPKAIESIELAIKNGEITQEEIDARCKKILQAKYWCGLNNKQEIVFRNIIKDLNTKESTELNDRLGRAAITVLTNDNNFLPLKRTDTLKIAEISFGDEKPNELFNVLKSSTYVQHFGLKHDAKPEAIAQVFSGIAESDVVVIQINKTTLKAANNFGIGEQTLQLIDSIARLKPTVLNVFANPYALNKLRSPNNFKAILLGYEYLPSLVKASAEAMLGYFYTDATLPVSTTNFTYGTGLHIMPIPVEAKINKIDYQKKKFAKVDSIAIYGINEKAYPGCQIVAMYDGEVIYNKCFGTQSYAAESPKVDEATIYDLASVTKITASALAMMKLESEQKFDHTKRLAEYLPQLEGTNKADMTMEDIFTHQSGMQAWIPFFLRTIDKRGNFKPEYISKKRSDNFPTMVAKKVFVVRGFTDSIYKRITESKLEKPGKYLYSDLGYYYAKLIIEDISKKPLDEYVSEIYTQMGLSLTYKPLRRFPLQNIAPTENDSKFRKQIVQGFVHDQGAALMGGVAGHAGLFGNAMDVAKLMSMYMSKGVYNGKRYLDSNVVSLYTSCRYCPDNRRGICFEKPEPDDKKDSPVTSDCSLESFGHTGFTGTFAWADPKSKLVVVFLSNRVFPDAEDNKLAKLGIRGKVHKAFYEAIKPEVQN
ncbi:MAG: serine hydrolase [Sphingobacteriaceae bacterium]|nr:serine hydrolase [Sphingobacteriaceae bacterium]